MSLHVDRRNTAVRRFRQGLARGLRTPEAVCTLHLLDRRFDRAEFVNALPTRFAPAYRARFGTVELRTRQAEFRQRIFAKYGGRCPISGCAEPSALEAAHLGSKGGWRTNHTDGILLRRDLHALMDAGKLEIVDGVVDIVFFSMAGCTVTELCGPGGTRGAAADPPRSQRKLVHSHLTRAPPAGRPNTWCSPVSCALASWPRPAGPPPARHWPSTRCPGHSVG